MGTSGRKTLRLRHSGTKGKGKGLMTIPELRKAFDHIQVFAEKLVREKRGDDQVARFQREWMKAFGKQVEKRYVVAYLNHIAGAGAGAKQKGGAALSGAPLDYSLQPGVYLSQGSLPVGGSIQSGGSAAAAGYGNYLQYVAGGFDVGVPARANQMQCGQVDQTPALRAGLGDNTYFAKAGGKRRRTLRHGRAKQAAQAGGMPKATTPAWAGGMRWFAATNPASFARDIADGWQGTGTGPSPSATDPTWAAAAKGASTSLNWSATPIPRSMGVDVASR
jgi:hypothetical protein